MHSTCSIILAAGKGTRLRSTQPKVMHEILGYPLVYYSLALVRDISKTTIVVVGHGRKIVMQYLKTFPVTPVIQEPQLGTGHAILMARPALEKMYARDILILPGDMPLIRKESLMGLMKSYRASNAAVGVLTARIVNPYGYGRIVRDKSGKVKRIVEHNDATEKEKKIDEINTSVYIMNKEFLLSAVERIDPDNAKGEFYLTDVVAMTSKIVSYTVTDPDEAHGINSRAQLAFAQAHMQARVNKYHMDSGVTFMDPQTTWINPEAIIEQDVEIWPNVHIMGPSRIEAGVKIMPNVWIKNSTIGASSTIGFGSIIEGTNVKQGSSIAPNTRISQATGAHD
jgi:bifunctional UDP-N-acetylglucosamine pyrophosphorylase/glucosamine-1-phosphate N-acetyltransferase